MSVSIEKGIRMLPNKVYRLYVTRDDGRPYQPLVTWKLLTKLGIEAPARTRQQTPGIELARLARTKLETRIMDGETAGLAPRAANAKKATVADLHVLHLDEFEQLGRKSGRDIKHRWSLHLKPFFGGLTPAQVTSERIRAYVRMRLKDKAANATVNRETSDLQHMLRLGQRTSPPLVQVVPYFQKLKEAAPRKGFMEQSTYDKLREHATELWLRGLLAAAYSFAWRKEELLGLRAGQISLPENTITLGDSKNGDPRIIVLTAEVRTLLAALIEGKRDNDPVFTRENGEPVKDFRGSWDAMFESAGIPRRIFHDLRRSGIRNLVRAGIHRDTAMKISGHRTDSTFRRYNIQSLGDLQEAAAKIEARAASLRAEAAATATKPQLLPEWEPDAEETIQ
jgi:site-specific recombinase XerD